MAAIAIIGAGAFGVSQVSAATDNGDPRASLIQKLADTLHVDKSKVQAVFDEHHSEMKVEHEKAYEARLTQAVTDGKLTSAQKDAVLAEHKKLAAKMEITMKDTNIDTPTERKAAMDKIRTEGEEWAKTNNIDAKWLMGPGRMHGEKGMRMIKHLQGADEMPATSPATN